MNSSEEAKSFVRTSFDYGVRQRRTQVGFDQSQVRLVLTLAELNSFQTFWGLLKDGSDPFETDQVIHQDHTIGKRVRFILPYEVNELGNSMFEVNTAVELLGAGVMAGNESQLEKITEGGKTGWRVLGRIPNYFGDIGSGAIDFSHSSASSSTMGATGNYSFTSGYNTMASATYSTAQGFYTQATGLYSHATGEGSHASGDSSTAQGKATIAAYTGQHVTGAYNFNQADTIFEVGIGTDGLNRANGLEVYKDGRVRAPWQSIADHTDNRVLATKEYVDSASFGTVTAKQALIDVVGCSDLTGTYNDILLPFQTVQAAVEALSIGDIAELFIKGNAPIDFDHSFFNISINFYPYGVTGGTGFEDPNYATNTSTLEINDNIDFAIQYSSNFRFYINMNINYGSVLPSYAAFRCGDTSSLQFYNHRPFDFTNSMLHDGDNPGGQAEIVVTSVSGVARLATFFGSGSTFTLAGVNINDINSRLNLFQINASVTISTKLSSYTFTDTTGDPAQDFIDRITGLLRYADGAPVNILLPMDVSGTTGGASVSIDHTATTDQTDFVIGGVHASLNVYTNGVLARAIEYTIANDGTDTTVTFTAPRNLNDWVRITL